MPRVKRKPHRRRRAWTDLHRLQLLHGPDFMGDAFGNDEAFDVDSARLAWSELRDELIAEWIAESPGSRPFGFWTFDAPEPMRRTGTMKFKPGIGPRSPRRFDRDSREFIAEADFPPAERISYWRRRHPTANAYALDSFDEAYAVYESETEYLERLGLLTDAEIAV